MNMWCATSLGLWVSCCGLIAAGPELPPPPRPQAVDTGPWLLGAVHCPLWRSTERWDTIRGFTDREPLLGFYREGDPDVTDWEIKWSLDHGISFFLVCWYRAPGNYGKPVRPELDHWVTSLDKSRYGGLTRYAVMFENNHRHFTGKTSRKDWDQNLVPFWIRNYFTKTNYLVLDRKPLLAIYDVRRFVNDLGGIQGATEALQAARDQCRQAGFDGLQVIGQYCWGTPEELRDLATTIQRVGMDASWAYHWPTFAGLLAGQLRPSSSTVISAQEHAWSTQPQPNILTVSMGWDSEPWRFAQTTVQWRLNPEEFEELCRRARTVLESRRAADLASKLLLLDNWNEYGEGHFIFPTKQYRFGYLDAVRKVFAPHAASHEDLVPSVGKAGTPGQTR